MRIEAVERRCPRCNLRVLTARGRRGAVRSVCLVFLAVVLRAVRGAVGDALAAATGDL